MTATPPPDIWTFALALYRQPGFADACLTLQDEHGADVVMLIGLCWLARRDGGAPDVSAIATLDAALAGWRDAVIVPLRTLRRALKPRLAGLPPAAGEARERIKEAELASERVAFDLFERAAGFGGAVVRAETPQIAARIAIERYLNDRCRANPADIRECVQCLAIAIQGLPKAPFP